MAKNKRGRCYRMTPRRKAALRKAQLASARQRRGRGMTRGRRRALAVGVAVVGAGVGAYAGHRGMRRLRYKKAHKQWITSAKSPQLALPRGRGMIVGTQTDSLIGSFDRSAKRAAGRVAARKNKEKREYRKRRKYWQGKPVAGHTIPAISTAGSRKAGVKRTRKKR